MPSKQVPSLRSRVRDMRNFIERLESYENRPKKPDVKQREELTEREFVRRMGPSVRSYRLSNRADYVGLVVCGSNTGFIITRDDKTGERKLRLIDVLGDKKHVTHRYILLKNKDSASLLVAGLRPYVS